MNCRLINRRKFYWRHTERVLRLSNKGTSLVDVFIFKDSVNAYRKFIGIAVEKVLV